MHFLKLVIHNSISLFIPRIGNVLAL